MKVGLKLLGLCFFLASCSSTPQKEQKPIHEVTCKYWLQQCHLKARKRCQRGHSVDRSYRVDKMGGPEGSYKEFKMFFTCN